MIPMVASITELRRAKVIVEEVKSELSKKGIPYARNISMGMMMETPAAAIMADRFAKEVDFFSIGTNDLTQYLFAADRNNEKVAALNSYFHPTLLSTVKHICDSAVKEGINVDICGQAGEIPVLIPLWIAMGVNNLSVSIPSIPKVRKIICETNKSKAINIMRRALAFDTEEEVRDYLNTQFCL
jgi:phosphotransferase system enzyme I (PtsI)